MEQVQDFCIQWFHQEGNWSVLHWHWLWGRMQRIAKCWSSNPQSCIHRKSLECFSNNACYRLSMVLSCPTTSAYIYCFSMAHTRPHFVISGKDMPSYLSKAMSAKCGMPKLILHSKPCLSSPIKVNNDDGSINFHLYSSGTKEFSETFDLVNTDFSWWMKQFDKLSDLKRKVDDWGFAENIDLGLACHGSSESTSATQNQSEKFVCALPHIIHKKQEEEFKQITVLLDQMTDFMDRHFLDNGCLLFNNPDRDNQFAGCLRSMYGGEKFRGEAFTIVRQRLGTIENVTKGECNFEPTKRHMWVLLLSTWPDNDFVEVVHVIFLSFSVTGPMMVESRSETQLFIRRFYNGQKNCIDSRWSCTVVKVVVTGWSKTRRGR